MTGRDVEPVLEAIESIRAVLECAIGDLVDAVGKVDGLRAALDGEPVRDAVVAGRVFGPVRCALTMAPDVLRLVDRLESIVDRLEVEQ